LVIIQKMESGNGMKELSSESGIYRRNKEDTSRDRSRSTPCTRIIPRFKPRPLNINQTCIISHLIEANVSLVISHPSPPTGHADKPYIDYLMPIIAYPIQFGYCIRPFRGVPIIQSNLITHNADPLDLRVHERILDSQSIASYNPYALRLPSTAQVEIFNNPHREDSESKEFEGENLEQVKRYHDSGKEYSPTPPKGSSIIQTEKPDNFLSISGDKRRIINQKESSAVYSNGKDNLMNEEKNPLESKVIEPIPKEEVKKEERNNRSQSKRGKTKASQAARLEYKTKFILAFRYRNVFKCILRNMYGHAESQKEKLIQTLLEEGFSRTSIIQAFEEIRQFKLANATIRKPKIKIDEMLKHKTPKTYIFRETLKSMLQRLEAGELQQVLQSNRPIYIEACNGFLLKANEILN